MVTAIIIATLGFVDSANAKQGAGQGKPESDLSR
jgi:hypothetical protein